MYGYVFANGCRDMTCKASPAYLAPRIQGQWFRAKASDYRPRERGFESCAEVLNLGPAFFLYVHSAV